MKISVSFYVDKLGFKIQYIGQDDYPTGREGIFFCRIPLNPFYDGNPVDMTNMTKAQTNAFARRIPHNAGEGGRSGPKRNLNPPLPGGQGVDMKCAYHVCAERFYLGGPVI